MFKHSTKTNKVKFYNSVFNYGTEKSNFCLDFLLKYIFLIWLPLLYFSIELLIYILILNCDLFFLRQGRTFWKSTPDSGLLLLLKLFWKNWQRNVLVCLPATPQMHILLKMCLQGLKLSMNNPSTKPVPQNQTNRQHPWNCTKKIEIEFWTFWAQNKVPIFIAQ